MSIVDIAKLAGVSHTTVSRVINNEGSVSSETASKIRAIMKKMGYVPKPPALRRGPRRVRDAGFKTGNIAFLTSSESLKILSSSPIMSNVLHGIEEALASNGMSMVQGAVGVKRPLPPIVAKGGVDGVIVWPHLDDVSPEAIKILRGYKVVYVMSGAGERLSADRVRVNHGKVGRLAAKYLAGQGHQTIAYVTPSSLVSRINLCERWAAFSALAKEHALHARQCVIEQSHFDLMEIDRDRDLLIQKTLEDFLAQGERPTGMFVTCDALCAKIYPSYLCRDGKLVLDSLSKVYLCAMKDDGMLDVQLQGQPVINALLRAPKKPTKVHLNGQSVEPTYNRDAKNLWLSVRAH
jgi:DNA-binding LacI/PurR family transcriptional regulator